MKNYKKYLNEVFEQERGFVGAITREELEELLDADKQLWMNKTYKDYEGKIYTSIADVYNISKTDEYGNVDYNDPIFKNPKIRWFRVPQSGGRIEEFNEQPNVFWGSGSIALFPDGNWIWVLSDWDSSG